MNDKHPPDRQPPDWLPPAAEELLSNWPNHEWPNHERSDADFERMARAIEARLSTVAPAAGANLPETSALALDSTDANSTDANSIETSPPASSEQLSARALAARQHESDESEDWLFRPPLPLISGERRHAPDSPAKSGTELSLKEIAQAALDSPPAGRPPLRSHVQRRSDTQARDVAGTQQADPANQANPANQINPADRQSRVNLVSRRLPTRPNAPPPRMRSVTTIDGTNVDGTNGIQHAPSEQSETSACSLGDERAAGNAEATSPRASHTSAATAASGTWWLWGGLAAAACFGVLFVKDLEPQPAPVSAPTVTVIHQITAAPVASDVSSAEEPTPPSPVAKLEAKPEATSLEELPVAKPRPVARAAKSKAPPPAAAADETKGAESPQPDRAEPQLVPAARPGALPSRPSIGAAQGAVGAKLGPARACLAGTYQPSKASVVFGSDGRVRSVQVLGPAQGTPAEPCIIKAMSSARLQPFADESFTIRTTVRP